MIGISGGRRIFLATQPIDFRKGMDTIAALVSEALKADPFCGDVFIFRPKRCDRLKILVWDGSGLILATKRLEELAAGAQRDDPTQRLADVHAARRPGVDQGAGQSRETSRKSCLIGRFLLDGAGALPHKLQP